MRTFKTSDRARRRNFKRRKISLSGLYYGNKPTRAYDTFMKEPNLYPRTYLKEKEKSAVKFSGSSGLRVYNKAKLITIEESQRIYLH